MVGRPARRRLKHLITLTAASQAFRILWPRGNMMLLSSEGITESPSKLMGEIIVTQTAKRTNCWALVSLITAISVGSVSCVNNGMNRSSASQQQPQAKPRETPVAFQPTKENGGKRCEALWYTGAPGDEHDSADNHCFRLQEKLIKGALDGKLTEIREALRDGAHVEGTAYNMFPALHSAAMQDHADAVALLLDNGANVNRVVDFENSALNMAVSDGHTDVVRVLLDRGADVCYKSAGGTAGDIARARGHKELADLLKAAETTKCK